MARTGRSVPIPAHLSRLIAPSLYPRAAASTVTPSTLITGTSLALLRALSTAPVPLTSLTARQALARRLSSSVAPSTGVGLAQIGARGVRTSPTPHTTVGTAFGHAWNFSPAPFPFLSTTLTTDRGVGALPASTVSPATALAIAQTVTRSPISTLSPGTLLTAQQVIGRSLVSSMGLSTALTVVRNVPVALSTNPGVDTPVTVAQALSRTPTSSVAPQDQAAAVRGAHATAGSTVTAQTTAAATQALLRTGNSTAAPATVLLRLLGARRTAASTVTPLTGINRLHVAGLSSDVASDVSLATALHALRTVTSAHAPSTSLVHVAATRRAGLSLVLRQTAVATHRGTVSLASAVTPQTRVLVISPASVAAALAGQYGPVVIRYRLDWRDAGFRYLGDLSPAFLGGQISLDNDQAVARTCQLDLDGTQLPAGWLDTPQAQFCVALWADVLVLGQTVSFSLGAFTLDAPAQQFGSGNRELWQVQGSDYAYLLASRVPTGPYTAAAGANILSLAAALIDAQPAGLVRSLPLSTATLPVAVSWPPQTDYLTIVNDLLFGLNYAPLWCTAAGVLTSAPRPDPAGAAIAVTYSTQVPPLMVVEPYGRQRQAASEDNICVVAVDDPSRTPPGAAAGTGLFSVTRKNVDPASPVSLANDTRERTLDLRGSSTPSTKAVPDLVTAEAIARTELGLAAARALPATLRTLPDPRRTNNEYYQLLIDTREQGTAWRVGKWTYVIPAQTGPSDVTPSGVTALTHTTGGSGTDIAMVHELEQVMPLVLA